MFFFNDTATTEIYTLSLHDALPIYERANYPGTEVRRFDKTIRFQTINAVKAGWMVKEKGVWHATPEGLAAKDRKSTRLNSSHANISYAVFCLKKKTTTLHHLCSYIL